jgi:hypothetical protein
MLAASSAQDLAVDAKAIAARAHDQLTHHEQLGICRIAEPAHVDFALDQDGLLDRRPNRGPRRIACRRERQRPDTGLWWNRVDQAALRRAYVLGDKTS